MSCLGLAIATSGEWDADRLLRQLTAAGLPVSGEVHVACYSRFAPAAPRPGLSVHAVNDVSLFDLWTAAIAHGQSSWVAILHADALPAPGWFAAMQRAIESDAWPDGYWGSVEPGIAVSDNRMVGYLTEYCQFHRPADPRMKEVPGCNLVLPRARIGIAGCFSKTRLLEQGLSPKPIADAVVTYTRPFRISAYCRRRFRHGRAFAAARAPRLSLIHVLCLSAVLPFVRTARILSHAWRHDELRLASLRWLAMIFLAESCWSAGELVGYVTHEAGRMSALD